MGNDRYLIYELKNKKVQAIIPERFGSDNIDGIVKDVKRDILENRINLTVNKQMYVFREPDFIVQENENCILFVYGDINSKEVTDEELLEKMRSMALKGCHIDDAIKSLETDSIIYIKFNIIP
jgi:hypothetical protein